MAQVSLFLVVAFFVATSLAAPKTTSKKSAKLDVDKVDLETVTCPTLKCAKIGPPVCARRKDKLVVFPNYCALASFQCATGKTWKPIDMAICAGIGCPAKCSARIKSSVCASSGKDKKKFKNECLFRNYACENFHNSWSRQEKC